MRRRREQHIFGPSYATTFFLRQRRVVATGKVRPSMQAKDANQSSLGRRTIRYNPFHAAGIALSPYAEISLAVYYFSIALGVIFVQFAAIIV
jgi:hypothetical protein